MSERTGLFVMTASLFLKVRKWHCHQAYISRLMLQPVRTQTYGRIKQVCRIFWDTPWRNIV